MTELISRIIPKASATAGETPSAVDLAVAELAVNTADGALFTKHTDGSVVAISSGGGGGGAVDSVNGQTGVVVLDIDDLISSPPSDGNLLQFDAVNGEWEPAGGVGGPSGSSYRYASLSENPMLGPTSSYAGLTEMLADGWTEIPGYATSDDAAVGFFPPQTWQDAALGVTFLSGQVRSYEASEFFVNTNGGCGFDKNGSKTPGRSGVATSDATLIDLYVCHKSADLKGKLAGWQETVEANGVRLFHVRQSYLDPYNGADYWVVETVFSSDGCVTVKYGDATAPDDIPNHASSTVNHGIVIYDSLNPGVSGKNPILSGVTLAGFPGLTPAGNYVFETYNSAGSSALKIKLEDLADVAVMTPPIADGAVLAYDGTTELWNPSTDSISKAALMSAVAASTDFTDFKSRIAAL